MKHRVHQYSGLPLMVINYCAVGEVIYEMINFYFENIK